MSRILAAALVLVGLQAGAADIVVLDEADRKAMQERANQLPVETSKTTPEQRERLRREGKPVMTVKAQPGYGYRDYQDYAERAGAKGPRMPNDRRDITGCVTVSFEILPDGKTDAFEIVKSEPAGVFEKIALRTVYATEFEPPAPVAGGARPRYERTLWFLLAAQPPVYASMFNERHEKERQVKREAQRAACEGPKP